MGGVEAQKTHQIRRVLHAEPVEHLAKETGPHYSRKKYQMMFLRDKRLLKVLGIKEQEQGSD